VPKEVPVPQIYRIPLQSIAAEWLPAAILCTFLSPGTYLNSSLTEALLALLRSKASGLPPWRSDLDVKPSGTSPDS